jgi:Alpha/beta hydrolase family
MRLMQRRFERRGYDVHAYSYPTMRLTLRENAERLGRYCKALTGGRLHFVGHSMGGLVALQAAALVPAACRGRIVLIGTPFADSFSGRCVQRLPGGRRVLGKCMGQWLADSCAVTADDCEVGVIAGSGGVGLGRVVAPGLPKPNDGVVAVSETIVPGMRDHVVLPVSHTAMLISQEVVRQACEFLERGKFARETASAT